MKDTNSRACIMKIASGPMTGQELMINVDKNRIIIGKDINYKTDTDENGFTTYSIPSEETNCDFSITSEDNNPEGQIAIQFQDKNQKVTFNVILQELLLVDIFPVIIKLIDTPWEASNSEKTQSKTTPSVKPKQQKKIKNNLFYFLALLTVFLSSIIIIQNKTNDIEATEIKSLESTLKGTQYPIIASRKIQGKNIILVKTQRDLDWITQRLIKINHNENFIIKKIDQFEDEIEDQLIKSIPDILKIDISNPCQPIIRKSSSNSHIKKNKVIDDLFSTYFICYQEANIVQINFDELLKKSELGMTESDVKWHKIVEDNKTIYVIKDSLNDKQTISLINFTNSFYQRWGRKKIQFSVSLADNEFAGKSFITNTNGYVLLGNNHWLFNSIKF